MTRRTIVPGSTVAPTSTPRTAQADRTRRPAPRTPPADRFDRRLVLPMVLGSILNPVNSSIIAVALIPIGRALGAGTAQTAWLVSALYLATAIGQPLVGRLVDAYGPRRLFLIGTALVGVAGVLGTVAPDLGTLIAARVLLGFGTCAGYPAAMYLIRSEAGRTGIDSPAGILTTLAVASQTIAVVGPTVGGLLIGLGGWRATFAVNIPLSLACLVLGALRLPRTPTQVQDGRSVRLRDLDPVGVLLFAATLIALLLFLMDIGVRTLPLLALAALTGAGFALRELRTPDPFIDLRVLAGNPPLLVTYLRTVLAYTVSYAFIYGFTQWLEDARDLTPSTAGLVLLPVFGIGILVSTTTGRRPEIKGKLLVGAASQVVGCALLLLLDARSSIGLLLLVAAVVGIPQGLNSLANQNAVYHQADPARMGASAGLLRTFMYLGAILASAATGSFFGERPSDGGLHRLALLMVVISVLFLLVTVLDRSLARVGRPSAAPA
ncbi:MAG TPA: MFS transporter [Friedmanniella sp.]